MAAITGTGASDQEPIRTFVRVRLADQITPEPFET